MSRIGRAPIDLPEGVEVTVEPGGVRVEGPKGTLQIAVSPRLTVEERDGQLIVKRPGDQRSDRAQQGLARSLIANAVTGVTEGFMRNLEIRGVGYRCALQGRRLELIVGFSHTVMIDPPEGITIEAPSQTKITVSGIDKQKVGQVAANIRSVRPPDSYHGKGVRYEGESVRLKPGKAAVAR